ncbi:MAG: hypothetical protein HY432_02535 [Candidatus Liptonbacteria bacterium]|nr:hypothetical protein [Candidatus Liptonbacteria bacterium]
MKIAATIFLSLILIVLGNQIRFFSAKNTENETRYAQVKKELEEARRDYGKVEANFSYYTNPNNLEKELRARFNYKLPGEKMIIIVPESSSTNQ